MTKNSKVRLKDSIRERIEKESERLGKGYLETLYFIIEMYFIFVAPKLGDNTLVANTSTVQPHKSEPEPLDDGYEIDIDI